jgi:septum formation protein
VPDPPRLILASSSPRRAILLREAGYDFTLDPPGVDEAIYPPGMLPSQVALYLAEKKATSVAERRVNDVVLAADTVVAFGDTLLGKPGDALQAKRMLTLLSGTTHIVITGVWVMHMAANFSKGVKAMSAVRMRMLGSAEIDKYVAGGDWKGKAGGYGIQDADPFVIRQAGSHSNIVGLPMEVTTTLVAEAGIVPQKKS